MTVSSVGEIALALMLILALDAVVAGTEKQVGLADRNNHSNNCSFSSLNCVCRVATNTV